MYSYNIGQWILIFYSYCFFGWCIESAIVSIKKKKLVNRGFLRGPLLPIYGSGAVMVLIFALPVRHNVFLVFILGMIGATVLEYVTGCLMEAILKVRYWDYSNNFLNVEGHICLTSSLFWGVLSVFMIYVIHEPIEDIILNLSPILINIASLAITLGFCIDFYYSASAAYDLAKFITKMHEIRTEMDRLLVNLKDEAEESMRELGQDAKAEWQKRQSQLYMETQMRVALLQDQKDELVEKLGFFKRQLIQSNPTATAKKFNGALEEIRDRLEQKMKDKVKNYKEKKHEEN